MGWVVFSLRQVDLLWRSCPSVCQSVIDFLIFRKRGFESKNNNLSDITKFILLDSLLQEVTAIVLLPNPRFSTIVCLPNPELNSVARLPNRKFSAVV